MRDHTLSVRRDTLGARGFLFSWRLLEPFFFRSPTSRKGHVSCRHEENAGIFCVTKQVLLDVLLLSGKDSFPQTFFFIPIFLPIFPSEGLKTRGMMGRKMRGLGKNQQWKRKVTCYVTKKNAGIHNKCCCMCCYSVARTFFVIAELSSSFRSFYLFSRRRSHQQLFRNNLRFVCMASEPPAKRTKKEIAETSDSNGGDESILATYMAKRQKVCKSVVDFKFDKKRVRLITSNVDMPETCKGIAYWMWREQRVQGMPNMWNMFYNTSVRTPA